MNKPLLVFLGCWIALPGQVIGQQDAVGTVKKGQGEIRVIRGQQELPLQIGAPLYRQDTLRTGASSSLGVVFTDNTTLSLGPKSQIVIDEYVFAPEKGKLSMILRMLKGTAAYLSGIIARQSPGTVKFQLPDATIGVRGTQFLVQVKGS